MKQLQYRRDLYKLFGNTPGKAVEIGVAEGNFSEDMLKWMIDTTTEKNKEFRTTNYAISKLYMVDRWRSVPTQKGDASMPKDWHENNLMQVRTRTAPYRQRAVILRGDSVAMAEEIEDGSLTLVYIDGDHSYEGVFADLRAWTPKLKSGGWVALHDYLNPNYGVREAVMDFCSHTFEINVLNEDKPEDAGCYFQIV